MGLIVKSNIKKVVKELQKENEEITSVAEEVGTTLDIKIEEILEKAIQRAKANKRRTLHARDL
ncbi:MAG: histone-like protein [Nanoarchaeota archaeon]|nr:histone-like protein [Nanoarchaeota archaeon]